MLKITSRLADCLALLGLDNPREEEKEGGLGLYYLLTTFQWYNIIITIFIGFCSYHIILRENKLLNSWYSSGLCKRFTNNSTSMCGIYNHFLLPYWSATRASTALDALN